MKYSLSILILLANVSFANYSNHPEAADLIDTLVSEHGFDRGYVIKVLETAQKQNKILDSMSSPAEFTWTWDRYKKLFIEDKRIANGKIFIEEHNELFNKVEEEFGVPREIITSILGCRDKIWKN